MFLFNQLWQHWSNQHTHVSSHAYFSISTAVLVLWLQCWDIHRWYEAYFPYFLQRVIFFALLFVYNNRVYSYSHETWYTQLCLPKPVIFEIISYTIYLILLERVTDIATADIGTSPLWIWAYSRPSQVSLKLIMIKKCPRFRETVFNFCTLLLDHRDCRRN